MGKIEGARGSQTEISRDRHRTDTSVLVEEGLGSVPSWAPHRHVLRRLDLTAVAERVIELEGLSQGVHRPVPGRSDLVRRHGVAPGVHAFGVSCDEELVGVGYGVDCRKDDWWTQQVRRRLRGGESEDVWLAHAHRIVALYVEPGHQGHGLGRAILEQLMESTDRPFVTLATPLSATRARALYRSVGMTEIATDVRFYPDGPPFWIMMGRNPITGASRPPAD